MRANIWNQSLHEMELGAVIWRRERIHVYKESPKGTNVGPHRPSLSHRRHLTAQFELTLKVLEGGGKLEPKIAEMGVSGAALGNLSPIPGKGLILKQGASKTNHILLVGDACECAVLLHLK